MDTHIQVSILSIFKIFYILKNALLCLSDTSGPVPTILNGKAETASSFFDRPFIPLDVVVP